MYAQSAEILSGCRPFDWKMHICISQLKGKKIHFNLDRRNLLGMHSKSYNKYHIICHVILLQFVLDCFVKGLFQSFPVTNIFSHFGDFFITLLTAFFHTNNGNRELHCSENLVSYLIDMRYNSTRVHCHF